MRPARILRRGDVGLLGDHLSHLELGARASRLLRRALALVVVLDRAKPRLELFAAVLLLPPLVLLLEHHPTHGILRLGDAALLSSHPLSLGSRPLGHGHLPLDPAVVLLRDLLREVALGSLDRGVRGDAPGILLLLDPSLVLVLGANSRLGVAAARLLGCSHRRLLPSSLVLGELGEAFDLEVERGAAALLRLAQAAVHEHEPLELSLRGAAALVLLGPALRLRSHHLLERELGGGDLRVLGGAVLGLLLRESLVLGHGVLEGAFGRGERVLLEVQRRLRSLRRGEPAGLKLAVEAPERLQEGLVGVRGFAPAGLLVVSPRALLLGGADRSLSRVGSSVILRGNRRLLDGGGGFGGGASLLPAKVLLRALRLLLVEGVLKRLRGDGAAFVLLEPAPALILRGGLHRLLGGLAPRVFALAASLLRLGASLRVGVGGGAARLLGGADSLSLGGFAFHVNLALPRRRLRLVAKPRLGDRQSLLLRLDVPPPLVLLLALGDLSLRHALHLHVRLLPALVLGEPALRLVVHRLLRARQRLRPAFLLLLDLLAFHGGAGRGRSLRGEPPRLLLGELLLRRLLERELRGDGFGSSSVFLVAPLRLRDGSSPLVLVSLGASVVLGLASRRFVFRGFLHGGVGGVASSVLVRDAFLLRLLGSLGVGGGSSAAVVLGLDPALLLLEGALHGRDGDRAALLLLLEGALVLLDDADRLHLELVAAPLLRFEQRRVGRLHLRNLVDGSLLAGVLLGPRPRLGLGGDRHVLLDHRPASALGFLHVGEGPAASLGVVVGVGSPRLDVSLESLEGVGGGSNGVVLIAAPRVLLRDLRLLLRGAFPRRVGGLHPSEVFPRPALILLGGELAALLEGSLVDHALGGGAPRVLLRPEPRLLVH